MKASKELLSLAQSALRFDEGWERTPYDCKTGKRVRAPIGYVTIGCGRNLDSNPLDDEEILFLLNRDIQKHWDGAVRLVGQAILESFSLNRQLGVLQLVFNLGEEKLRADFTDTIPAIITQRWPLVRIFLRKTKWYQDVKRDRAERVLALFDDRFEYDRVDS